MQILTVIMQDNTDMVHSIMHTGDQGILSYRTIHIELTPEQLEQLEPKAQFEKVKHCFIEEKEE